MEDQWRLLQEVKAREQNRIEAQACVPIDSLWFSGHFPGEPILPGIALIHLVWQAIVEDAGKRSEEIRLDTLKRVRFIQPVRPGENLEVLVTGGKPGEETYLFKVVGQGKVICSGLIAVVKKKDKYAKKEVMMPESKDIKGIIRHVAEIIIDELKLEEVTIDTFSPDMDLIDELGIDSMDLATIALVLQDEYKIVIDEDDYPKMKTVRLIAEYIEEKISTES